MHKLLRTFCLAASAAAVVLGLSACTSFIRESSPSHFYVLSADLPEGQQPFFKAGQAGAPTVAVANVRVAAYLERPQMTYRSADNKVLFSEFVRWAEPLSDGVGRTLRTNLVSLLGTPDSALPWTRAYARDFNLFMQVEDIHFKESSKELELHITYRLSHGKTNAVVLSDEVVLVHQMPAATKPEAFYEQLAGLISRQIGEFSVVVADRAAALKQEQAAKAGIATLKQEQATTAGIATPKQEQTATAGAAAAKNAATAAAQK